MTVLEHEELATLDAQGVTNARIASLPIRTGSFSHLCAFHGLVKGLFWPQTLRKFTFRKASVGIKIQSADDSHALSGRGKVVVFTEEGFQIFLVDVTVLPIVDRIEGQVHAKALRGPYRLLDLFRDTI